MAKKPIPRKGAGASAAGIALPSRTPQPPQSEAVGKFDKFSAFGLVLPCLVLALITLVMAIGYTAREFDTGLFGFPGKTVADWDSGNEAVRKGTGAVQITGFSQSNYIARSAAGEVDVAELNVGRMHGVNLGDVFTLTTETPDVRLEFVVFDVQAETSQAYILLGQNVSENRPRQYSLRLVDIERLCGGASGVQVQRLFKDQIVRRGIERRSAS